VDFLELYQAKRYFAHISTKMFRKQK